MNQELPENFGTIAESDGVSEITPYKGSYADFSIIMRRPMKTEIRVYYLRNLREDWEWVEDRYDEEHGNGFILLKRRAN